MYGPNYSGFAFHPKTVRMVGPVHWLVFLRPIGRCVSLRPASATLPRPQCTVPDGAKSLSRQGSANPTIACAITAFSIDLPVLIPCAVWLMSIEHCRLSTLSSQGFRSSLRHLSPRLFPRRAAVFQKNKNGVFHVKHAAHFPPTPHSSSRFFCQPEVCFDHARILCQLGRWSFQRKLARLQHIAVVRDLQCGASILLDQQRRDACAA